MDKMLICVDETDQVTGKMEKMEVHQKGCLHRAFSIFIFNSEGKMLLQKRAKHKYHSGGLWTNACCSHPVYKEELEDSVHKRIMEEMGFDCRLKEVFSFVYKAELDHGLIEYEFDHVFAGKYDGEVLPDSEEAEAYSWVLPEEVTEDVNKHPEKYTVWFGIALEKVLDYYRKK